MQLKFTVDGKKQLRGDMIMNIELIQSPKILLVGYTANTKKGFKVMGKCMKQLQANQKSIANRADTNSLIGLNDYTRNFNCESAHPIFDFYAAFEVTEFSTIPEGMVTKELPAGNYIVFKFIGKPQDSLQPVADYIYREWFPQSTCQFNEQAMYDFTKSFEALDRKGNSEIEYWVPVL
jgi:AraC family transcriptional regulator